jgi:hypothetical protein
MENSDSRTAFGYNRLILFGAGAAVAAILAIFWQFKLPLASAIAGGLVFLIVATVKPSVALALLCAVLPVEGIAARSLQMSEVRLVGFGALAIWIAHLLLHGKRIRFDRTFLFGLALVAWAGLSITWAVQLEGVGSYYFTLLQTLVLFLLCINVVQDETDFRIVMAGLLLGALASSPMALNVFVQNVIERARVYEAQNPNGYSLVIGFSILAGLYLVRTLKGFWLRMLLLAGTLFLAVPLVLAQSRTGWLATGCAVAVTIWYTRHRVRNFLLMMVFGVAMVGVLFATGLVNITLVDRANELVTLRNQGSNRLDVWRVAGNVIADNPVVGVGFHQFPRKFNQYRAETPSIRRDQIPSRDPHNTYIGVMAELGIVGLALLLLMFWSACREEDVPPGRRPWISDTMVAYVMVFSIGGTILLAKLFWVALALAAKARTIAAAGEPEAAG